MQHSGKGLCQKMIDEADVKRIVQITIQELKRQELLKDAERVAYEEISERLKRFFTPLSGQDDDLAEVLEQLKSDKYRHILWMFYRDHYTVEEIAERLNVDVRTVSRNKKRLCLEIYSKLTI